MVQLRISQTLFLVYIAILGATDVVRGQSQSAPTPSSYQGTTTSGMSSTTTETKTSSTSSSAPTTVNTTPAVGCSPKPDLKTYCGHIMTRQEMDFFQNDTSIKGVLAKILTPGVVDALKVKCDPGSWCLDDSYRKSISDGKSYFYTTPICQSDNLWTCLETIDIKRRNCNESELLFAMSTIGLMCDMDAIDGGYITTECFTRSLEAVHVTYSDIHRDWENKDKDKEVLCTGYNKKMTDTFACAINACDMEQRVFLEDYGPWSFISSVAEDVFLSCNMTLQCQGGYPTQNVPSTISTSSYSTTPEYMSDLENALGYAQTTEGSIPNEEIEGIESVVSEETAIDQFEHEMYETTMASDLKPNEPMDSGEQIVNEQGMDLPGSEEDVDQTFVYGMVIVTAVVIISLTLMGVLAFRRFSRIRKNYKQGYSQMTEEESRMLRNEYN